MDNKERANNIRERVKRLQDVGIKPSVYATYLGISPKKIYNFLGGKINFVKDLDVLDELERLITELEEIFFKNN